MVVEAVLLDLSVAEEDVAGAVLRDFGVVGHEDDGVALVIEFLEEDEHLERGAGVEITRSLVGQDDGGVVDEGARNGHALHLTAGHLVGLVVETFAEADSPEGAYGTFAAFGRLDLGIVHEGQLDILDGCGLGQEVIVLEDEANLAVAELGTLVLAHLAYGHTVEEVFAGRGSVETSELVEQGGFAGTRGALNGDELAFINLEGHPAEGVDNLVADLEVAAHVLEFDDYVICFHNRDFYFEPLFLLLRGPGMKGLEAASS